MKCNLCGKEINDHGLDYGDMGETLVFCDTHPVEKAYNFYRIRLTVTEKERLDKVKDKEEAQEKKRLALLQLAKEIAKTTQCNCDLDKWEPERSTGHSWVCDIHKQAMKQFKEG